MTETQYCRLNEPLAYGDPGEADSVVLKRAVKNLDIEGLDGEYLDIEVELVDDDEDRDDVKVARLYTLYERGDGDRVTVGGDPVRDSAVEHGDRDYWHHIWESYTVEGDHIYDG